MVEECIGVVPDIKKDFWDELRLKDRPYVTTGLVGGFECFFAQGPNIKEIGVIHWKDEDLHDRD